MSNRDSNRGDDGLDRLREVFSGRPTEDLESALDRHGGDADAAAASLAATATAAAPSVAAAAAGRRGAWGDDDFDVDDGADGDGAPPPPPVIGAIPVPGPDADAADGHDDRSEITAAAPPPGIDFVAEAQLIQEADVQSAVVVPVEEGTDDSEQEDSVSTVSTESVRTYYERFRDLPWWKQVGWSVALLGIPAAALGIWAELREPPSPTPTPAALISAERIECGLGHVTGSTRSSPFRSAETCGDAPATSSDRSSRGKWYSLLGDGSRVALSTCNGETQARLYDTRIRVYEGSSASASSPPADGGGLKCVAGTDDDGGRCSLGGRLSTVTFVADPGVAYSVLVDGGDDRQTDGGYFRLDVDCRPTAAGLGGEATLLPFPSPTALPESGSDADAVADVDPEAAGGRPTSPSLAPTLRPTPPPTPPPTPAPRLPPATDPAPAGCTFGPSSLKWTKILADDGAAGDMFGRKVAVDGDTIIVGARWNDHYAANSGSAYVFARRGDKWEQRAKLVPDDGAAHDEFGQSVAVDGDTIVVGVWRDNDNGDDSGSVHVFARTGDTWIDWDKLLADDGAAHDDFGVSVAVDGDTIVVGAWGDDDNGHWSGSAYVFARTGDTWQQQAKLLPDDGAAETKFGYSNDEFGRSVAIDGDTIVVGCWSDNFNGIDSGSAYVFARTGSTWQQQAKLLAGDGAEGDKFGSSVAVDGDTILVGAWWDNDNGDDSGSVYVFSRTGVMWDEQAKLLAGDGAAGDEFGYSVAIDGDTIVVGARQDNIENGSDIGSAYVFARTGGTWVERVKLVPDDGAIGDRFGVSVAIDGDTVVVGAERDDDSSANSGSAYVVKLC